MSHYSNQNYQRGGRKQQAYGDKAYPPAQPEKGGADQVFSSHVTYVYTEGETSWGAETLEAVQRQRGLCFQGSGEVVQHITKVYRSGRVETEKVIIKPKVQEKKDSHYYY